MGGGLKVVKLELGENTQKKGHMGKLGTGGIKKNGEGIMGGIKNEDTKEGVRRYQGVQAHPREEGGSVSDFRKKGEGKILNMGRTPLGGGKKRQQKSHNSGGWEGQVKGKCIMGSW